jgi:L-ribulose-5-phosphate 3-epimerase
MNKLGIMSGRLSPPINGKIQSFPYHNWQNEFPLAEELGLQCMEWIFELPNIDENPICTEDGIRKLLDLSQKHNIKLGSLVADNFMEERLFGENVDEVKASLARLFFLIDRAAAASIPIIEIPLLGKTSIRSENRRKQLIKNIPEALDKAQQCNIIISFELDLPAEVFLKFIKELNRPNVGVNFDMGNSAMLGFDAEKEIELLQDFVINVHVKDGIVGGGTVPLGKGNAKFEIAFSALNRIGYNGDYILQAAREDLPDCINPRPIEDTIGDYIEFVKKLW